MIFLKRVFFFSLFSVLCILFLFACVPQNPNKKETKQVENSRGNRTTTRGNSKNETADKNSSRSSSRTTKRDQSSETQLNTDSLNIVRLAELAVNKQNSKTNIQQRRNSTRETPESKREELLKDIIDERDRFIDTTYYMLRMQEGNTEIVTGVSLAAGKNQDYYENLIRSFISVVEEAERSYMTDCSIFSIYANQFDFNDSLRQEALFYAAECLVNSDQLQAAANQFEDLSKEKLNRGVAPKVYVRLGQVYCLMGDRTKANRIFNRLKKEYPRSVYIQLADCNRL